MQLHLFELFLLFLSIDDLLLHLDLLVEVLLLEFSELAYAHEGLLVPGQRLAHRQLVLVLQGRLGSRAIAIATLATFNVDLTDGELSPSRRQCRRVILEEQV